MKADQMHNGQSEPETGHAEDSNPDKFYLIVVPDFGKPECKEFTAKDDLVVELRKLVKKRVSCFIVKGERWHISLPPRKLISSNNIIEADLTHVDDSVEIDVDGFLFDDPDVIDDDEEFNS
jgi:hypothetical protein